MSVQDESPYSQTKAENKGPGSQYLMSGAGDQNVASGSGMLLKFHHQQFNINLPSGRYAKMGIPPSVGHFFQSLGGSESWAQEAPSRGNILKWLTTQPNQVPINFSQHQRNLFAQVCQSTGEWVLNTEELLDWKEASSLSRVLWMQGILGSGKTMLMSLIINSVEKEVKNRDDAACIYFFFQEEKSSVSLARIWATLLIQLLRPSSNIAGELKAKFNDPFKRSDALDALEYFDLFKAQAAAFKTVYLFIDALDSCQNAPRELTLKSVQKALGELQDNVRVLFTSRDSYIGKEIGAHRKLFITPKETDVMAYIRKRIIEDTTLRSMLARPENRDEIIRGVTTKTMSSNMFLSAKLYMDYLSKQQTASDIKKALSHLPDSALRAFKASTKQIAQKIKANSGSGEALLTKHILLWVSHAKVDLNIEQIQDSFAVLKSEGQCYEDYRPVESLVWRACTELVRTDSEKGTLTLAHKSVKKHLQQCEIIPNNADLEIGKTCLYFLVNACNEKGRSPLLQYAAKYWWAHLNSKGQVLDEKIDSLVMKFLRDGSNLTRAFKTMEMTGGSAFDGMTGLHAAVHFDLLSWAERLASSVDVDAQCSDGQTALHWAVRYGRHKFLELLVRVSANPDIGDQAGDTPLHKALVGPAIDNVAVVEALLKGHARLDVRNKEGVSPLERVIQYGPTSIAKMMIESQKDVNAEIFGDWTLLRQIFSHSQDICGVVDQGSFRTKNREWNRLQVAVRDHTDFLTNLLLERGVDLNRPSTRDGWVPLVFAASKGDLSKMRRLLTRQPNPAKVGMRDRKGKTPLWWATHNKEAGAIQLLAEHGADVNETYTDGLTPLHEAVKQKSSKAVQLLVSLGAKINTRTANKPMLLIEAIRLRDRDTAWVLLNVGVQPDEQDANGKSALVYAIESRDYALVWLLISKGAIVTASSLAKKSGGKSTCVQSPLELALRLDDHRAAWLLCEHGASPNTAVDDTGRTLLHLAVDRGNLRAVRLLVYHGAGIGAQGKGGLTPLHYAVLLEREDIVTLLVSQAPEPSSIDVTDAKGNTALALAAQKKCRAITQILIRHGASCNAVDPDGLTPVHHAARLGFSEGLRMLLDGGGNPNMADKELFTPVHHAINGSYADLSLVNMLAAAGANLEARDANRRTPLMLAAQLGEDELAAWLLDAGAGAQLRD